jgi:hypothetical protein
VALGKMRKIPVISWVAAGKWTETGETFLEEDVIEWIETDVKGEHNFGLKIKDDSMEPGFSLPFALLTLTSDNTGEMPPFGVTAVLTGLVTPNVTPNVKKSVKTTMDA